MADRIRIIAAFGMAALLGGCSLGSDYHRPDAGLPAAFRATPAPSAASAGPAAWPARDWWRGFGSADLDQLIADAEANSFDILAAAARVEQADAQVRISGAPLLPTVTGNGTGQWTRSGRSRGVATSTGSAVAAAAASGSSTPTTLLTGATTPTGSSKRYAETRTYNTDLQFSYEIDVWGRLRAQQQSAETSALYSRYDQEAVAQTTITAVAITYFTALSYADRLAVAERNLRDAEEILKAIRARVDAGIASELDVSQQETLVAGLRASIPAFRSQYQQEVAALAILVGRPPEDITLLPGTLATIALPAVDSGLPSALLERRPDIAAAEAQLIAANADIRSARANLYPQFTLTGQGGLESGTLSSFFGPGTLLFQVAAGVAQTVFDNGLKGGQLDQRRGRYDELLADYRKAVVQSLTDVEDALVAYQYATEQEQLEQHAVDTAQRAADIAKAQVEAGTSDIVTALQAQNALFSDLDTLAQVRLTRVNALVDLYKALGGGWTRSDTVEPPSTIYHGVL